MIAAEPVDLQIASYTAPQHYQIKAEDREVLNGVANVRDKGSFFVRCRSQRCYDIETGETMMPSAHAKDGVFLFYWDTDAQ